MITMIHPAGYPKSPAYSQGAEVRGAGRMLYVSGQVGVDAEGNVGQGIGEQAKIAVANVNAMLAQAGMANTDIAKVTIYLTDEAHLGEFMAAAGGTLPSPPPATTLLIVKALAAPNLFVEIEAIAVK